MTAATIAIIGLVIIAALPLALWVVAFLIHLKRESDVETQLYVTPRYGGPAALCTPSRAQITGAHAPNESQAEAQYRAEKIRILTQLNRRKVEQDQDAPVPITHDDVFARRK